MVLPLLVAATLALVWLLTVGAAQLRIVDAARETARAAARGDDAGAAVAEGVKVGPSGTVVVVAHEGDQVVVRASARVKGPGGLLGLLPGARVHASSSALVEAP